MEAQIASLHDDGLGVVVVVDVAVVADDVAVVKATMRNKSRLIKTQTKAANFRLLIFVSLFVHFTEWKEIFFSFTPTNTREREKKEIHLEHRPYQHENLLVCLPPLVIIYF